MPEDLTAVTIPYRNLSSVKVRRKTSREPGV